MMTAPRCREQIQMYTTGTAEAIVTQDENAQGDSQRFPANYSSPSGGCGNQE